MSAVLLKAQVIGVLRRRPLTANEVAQERLYAEAAGLGLAFFKGEGRGEIGNWPPEESTLLLGCTRKQAKRLGHQFKQNAVVWIGPEAVPELIMLMPLTKKEGKNYE